MQAWDNERAVTLIAQQKHLKGALLPMLHALQEEFGYVDHAIIPELADVLNISHAEVHGTITFYHDFKPAPGGRNRLQVCRAEACQSMGCDRLVDHLEKRLGVRLGETTADGAFTLDAVYCLGNCALSPAMMVDGRPYGRVSPEVADFLLDDMQKRAVKA